MADAKRSLFERLAALEQSARAKPVVDTGSSPGVHGGTLDDLGFERVTNAHGTCFVRVLRYDLLALHGGLSFAELSRLRESNLWRAVRVPEANLDKLRFYDTETSGLGTGAGTFPFLHAVGQVEGDEFVVYQYFLDDYSEEPALLCEMAERHFHPEAVLVSFNGKSFDVPLLKNRLIMHRISATLREVTAGLPHIDLLHPSRRLWKEVVERVSLAALEAYALGLARTDDLPGKEAPARYFEYLSNRDAEAIEPVLSHNAMDVCSLATLMTRMADVLDGRQPAPTARAWTALASWHTEWEEHDLARRCYVTATEEYEPDWRSHWLYALYCKRRGQFHEACQIWKEMTETFPWSIQPLVELAKTAEHRTRDLAEAERFVGLALDRLRLQKRTADAANLSLQNRLQGIEVELRHRLARIRNKRKDERSGIL